MSILKPPPLYQHFIEHIQPSTAMHFCTFRITTLFLDSYIPLRIKGGNVGHLILYGLVWNVNSHRRLGQRLFEGKNMIFLFHLDSRGRGGIWRLGVLEAWRFFHFGAKSTTWRRKSKSELRKRQIISIKTEWAPMFFVFIVL